MYFVFLCVLICSFTAQMVGLYKDPSGENVFQGKGNTIAQKESNIMTLRRDAQHLRVSLHLAQVKLLCTTAIKFEIYFLVTFH